MPEIVLERLPVAAVAFGLGVTVSRGRFAGRPGQIAALCAELRRRGVLGDLLAALDPELAKSVQMAEAADRMRMKVKRQARR